MSLKPATTKRKAEGKKATVSRYRKPNTGPEAKGSKAWKVPTMEKIFPTSSGSTYFVSKDLEE